MRRTTKWLPVFVASILFARATVVQAGGIEVPMQDSKAAGEADAFTAQADDPAAIFYNPAGLTQLQGTQFSAGAYYLQPEFTFEGDGAIQRMSLPSILPHIYAESSLGTENWRFAIGANDVYGINEDWAGGGPLATLVDNAELSVINIAPTVAYKVNQNLSLGLAFNIYYGDMYLTRNVVLAAPPAPEGQFRFRGDGVGFGATPSLLYKINSSNQFGLYYRSPFTLNMDGNAQITSSIIPEIGPTKSVAAINLPQSIGAGYAWKPITPLTVEGDIIWTDWHSLKQLTFTSVSPAFNGQVIPANWESGFTYRIGLQYKLDPHWALRAGYAYSQTSVPEDTFSPIVPDSNYHLFALGVGYSAPSWSLDLASNFIYRERRQIVNVNDPLVDGTWENEIYGLMLTFTARL
jgi:long-chain fatty acid transport protein